MPKAPSMFTFIGWIELPGAIVLRLPFILFKLVAAPFILLNKYNERVLQALPKPEQNPAYNEFYKTNIVRVLKNENSI